MPHLDQGGLASQAVTALLSAGAEASGGFHFSRDLQPAVGAGETGGKRTAPAGSGQPSQPGDNGAVAAGGDLLRDQFKPQEIANLLWALAKLVDNGRLQLGIMDGPASQAVTALLPQVESHQSDFNSQGVSNLLWALAKLVDNGRLHLDQDSLASQAVTALLPQVVDPSGTVSSAQHSLQPAVGAGETGGQRTAPAGPRQTLPARRLRRCCRRW